MYHLQNLVVVEKAPNVLLSREEFAKGKKFYMYRFSKLKILYQ